MIAFASLFLLVGAILAALPAGRVRADTAVQPMQPTAYPDMETPTLTPDPGYPAVTDTPIPDYPVQEDTPPVGRSPTPRSTLPVGEESPTPALEGSATQPSSRFLTEDAEMGGAQITPGQSETPAPSPTTTPTRVMITTQVVIVTQDASRQEGPGGRIDWGLFSIGFAIPVLAACGVVLYLLDRRPELFSKYHR